MTPPRRRRGRSVRRGRRRAAHRAKGLIFGRAAPYLRRRRRLAGCGILAPWRPARARRSSGAPASSSARARARRGAGGPRRDRPDRRRGGDRQDPAGGRAREPRPRAGFEVCSGARSISSAPSCRTSRSPRRCGRSARSGATARLAAARVRGRRSRCSTERAAPRRCCSCSRTCTGPTRRRSTSSSSSPTTSTTGPCCCSPPTGPTSRRRPSGCAASPSGVRRSGSALTSSSDRSRAMSSPRCSPRAPAAAAARLTDAIVARSEGNPFFAEELLAAGGERAASSRAAARPAAAARRRLDAPDAEPAAAGRGRRPRRRVPAAAGGRRRAGARRCAHRCGGRSRTACSSPSRRRARFRFRHALLAEAIYATILPGEREALHARLADELARGGARPRRELAPHWAAAGRAAEALAASVDAARAGRSRLRPGRGAARISSARSTLWDAVPDAAELAGSTSPRSAPARRSSPAGRAPRRAPSSSPQRAIDLVGAGDPPRLARLHERLARYLHESGSDRRRPRRGRAGGRARAGAAALRRPRARRSPSLGQALWLGWRFEQVARRLPSRR